MKSAFGVEHQISKAFDPERSRKRRAPYEAAGLAAGSAGMAAGAAGIAGHSYVRGVIDANAERRLAAKDRAIALKDESARMRNARPEKGPIGHGPQLAGRWKEASKEHPGQIDYIRRITPYANARVDAENYANDWAKKLTQTGRIPSRGQQGEATRRQNRAREHRRTYNQMRDRYGREARIDIHANPTRKMQGSLTELRRHGIKVRQNLAEIKEARKEQNVKFRMSSLKTPLKATRSNKVAAGLVGGSVLAGAGAYAINRQRKKPGFQSYKGFWNS